MNPQNESDLQQAFKMGIIRVNYRNENELPIGDLFSRWDDSPSTQAKMQKEFVKLATDTIQQAAESTGGIEGAIGPLCEVMFSIGRAFEELQVLHLRKTGNLDV